MTDYPIFGSVIEAIPAGTSISIGDVKPYVTAHSKEAADRVAKALNLLSKVEEFSCLGDMLRRKGVEI